MTDRLRLVLTGVVTSVLVASAAWSATATHSLRVGIEEVSFGSLEVSMPSDWTVTVEPEGSGTYSFSPSGAGQFKFLMTPLPGRKSCSVDQGCSTARKVAEGVRKRLGSVAVERSIPIREKEGDNACLRYVSVTDKTVTKPTATEFKYGTQGAAEIGHVLASFTILSNVENAPEVDLALEILRTARHVGGPVDPAVSAMAATRLAFPGRDWGLIVDLTGLELAPPEFRRQGASLRFEATSKEPPMIVTIFFEPAQPGHDPSDYRAYYRDRAFKAAPFKRENVREWEEHGLVLLGYTNITEVFRQPNVNAFLVKGAFWIDVHVSSTLGEEQAAKLFDRFLGSIRITDSK